MTPGELDGVLEFAARALTADGQPELAQHLGAVRAALADFLATLDALPGASRRMISVSFTISTGALHE